MNQANDRRFLSLLGVLGFLGSTSPGFGELAGIPMTSVTSGLAIKTNKPSQGPQ